jgi:hypothetical protein
MDKVELIAPLTSVKRPHKVVSSTEDAPRKQSRRQTYLKKSEQLTEQVVQHIDEIV